MLHDGSKSFCKAAAEVIDAPLHGALQSLTDEVIE